MEEFLPEFAARTFENWQSEFLQLFAMVVFTSFLIHKGSHESGDNDDEVNKRLTTLIKGITKQQEKITRRIYIEQTILQLQLSNLPEQEESHTSNIFQMLTL